MPVHLKAPLDSDLFPVLGVRIGVTEAHIKKANRKDLTVFLLDSGCSVAGVFTQNRFCAAPVQVCRIHLALAQNQQQNNQQNEIRALVINTGNANAGTGETGLAHAREVCKNVGDLLGVKDAQILPFSTGVIMETLPIERIQAGLPAAIADAKINHWKKASEGIMTTDTLPKAFSRQIQLSGQTINITGISKGAGMIRPNMATMLGFIATDAAIEPSLLQNLLNDVANQSFNRITIDGDTSTNDSFILIATNQAGNTPIHGFDQGDGAVFKAALLDVAQKLAQAIVRDGEGATKFITIDVENAKNSEEARQIAYAIAHSPLVKTAFFASDPNLGRILAAIGYAGVLDLDQTQIDLYLNDVHVVTKGGRHQNYQESDGQRVMKQSEITIRVLLGRGKAKETVWTCDLSHDYVSINADYRS